MKAIKSTSQSFQNTKPLRQKDKKLIDQAQPILSRLTKLISSKLCKIYCSIKVRIVITTRIRAEIDRVVWLAKRVLRKLIVLK